MEVAGKLKNRVKTFGGEMRLFGFDALYSTMILIWVLISAGTLGLLWNYWHKINMAGKRLFKKGFALSFSVGLTVMYVFIFVRQIISYLQTDSVYYLFIALGFFFLTIYMVLQSWNEFNVYEEGICHNLSFIHWDDFVDYQYADRDSKKVFKIMVNKKLFFMPKQEKTILLTLSKDQGDVLARVLKKETRNH